MHIFRIICMSALYANHDHGVGRTGRELLDTRFGIGLRELHARRAPVRSHNRVARGGGSGGIGGGRRRRRRGEDLGTKYVLSDRGIP